MTKHRCMDDQLEILGPAGYPHLFLIKKNGLLGILHETEGLLVLGDWDHIGPYRDGLALVFRKDRKGETLWGLIDTQGKPITPAREMRSIYPETNFLRSGMAARTTFLT